MVVITVVVEEGSWWEWSRGCGGGVSGSDGSGSCCGNTNILTLMKYHRSSQANPRGSQNKIWHSLSLVCLSELEGK